MSVENVVFLKEPGFTYDLFILFHMYFNQDRIVDYYTAPETRATDEEYVQQLLKEFGSAPTELGVFFRSEQKACCFMTTMYFEPYNQCFVGGYRLETVLDALKDHAAVIDNVLQYYFPALSAAERVLCAQSLSEVDKVIRASAHSDMLKSLLYSFFINPAAMIQTLVCELVSKHMVLSQIYERLLIQLNKLQAEFDFEKSMNVYAKVGPHDTDVKYTKEICVSFCVCNKDLVTIVYGETKAVLLFGINYEATLQYLLYRNTLPELDTFGAAISERNRVEILRLMDRRGELTVKDIEQEFGLTGTNVYYHLSMMIKAGLLTTRNRGRTVLYGINRPYFRTLCDMLNQFAKEK